METKIFPFQEMSCGFEAGIAWPIPLEDFLNILLYRSLQVLLPGLG